MPTSRYPFAHGGPVISALGVCLSEAKRLIKQRYENMLRRVIARRAICSLLSFLAHSYDISLKRLFSSGSMIMLPLKDTFAGLLPVEESGRANLIGKD